MPPTPLSFTPAIVLLAPLLLWTVGLMPVGWANARAQLMARLNLGAAWLAFASALLAAASHLFGATLVWTLFSLALPGGLGAFSVGTYVNGVTVIMLVLVSFVGVVVSRYARNYLAGDTNQGRFHKWLSLTLASILTLIVSSNLLMFSLAWMATSLCLHELLMFYRERPAAVLAAHKKFVASRIGDACLLLATFLIGSTLHTLEFADIFRIMAALHGPLPPALQWAALLIVSSAGLKSAQFPFHGWLLQVMEAPTPVSALLHAGIVNAGAFLIVRMSPIMSHAGAAPALLALIGLVTLTLASLVMLTQTSIKASLSWSTTSQMGFMLLECGLGLYSLAMLHLVAHSLYKAHAFLASGSGVDSFRGPTMLYHSTKRFQPGRLGLALLVAGSVTLGAGAAFGITVQQPALLATGAIVAIALSQLLLQAGELGNLAFLLRALGLSVIVSTAYFGLHALFDMGLRDSVLPLLGPVSTAQLVIIGLTIAAFLGLLLTQQFFRSAKRSAAREALYVHLYNGLYIDVYLTRILQRLWPSQAQPTESRGV